MVSKGINQITEEILQTLVDSAVLENKTIEYKQSLPGNSDNEKKEFLADVSSFANAAGGDLIYGIIEDGGTPKSIEGLVIENSDQEILRLDNMIRSGIEPRIPIVNITPVTLKNSKVALIIRVARSWISPHRVKSNDKFYSRSSNGKYPLDVTELRTAFALSETVTERIKAFRLERISKILADETPISPSYGARVVLHLTSVVSFEPGMSYNIDAVASSPGEIPPIYASGWNSRYNLDGFLTFSNDQEKKTYSYVQLFRNGAIEAVDGALLHRDGPRLYIPSVAYEEKLATALEKYLSLLTVLKVDLPIFVFLSLLNVKGYSMGVDQSRFDSEGYPIDSNILQLPEAIIERYGVNPATVLKPCFDAIWNACGYARSFNYNKAEEWDPK